jgi:hypothetical protein
MTSTRLHPLAAAAAVILFAPTAAAGAEDVKIEPGICAPALSFDGLLKSAGYEQAQAFLRLRDGKALMVYLPNEQRIARQRLKNTPLLWLESVEVVHEDENPKLPGGRRCVEGIRYVMPADLRQLRNYLDRVAPMFPGK